MAAAADAPVVAGVSGSEQSLSVVRVAAREAAEHGRPLHVVHAFNWEAALAAPSVAEARDAAERVIDRAVTVAGEVAPDVPVDGRVIEGTAVDALLRRAETAFLVVVGDGGMTARDCVSPEAAAVQVAARAGCTVLVARLAPPPVGPVLVGLDGSPVARCVLDFALDCAARNDGRLRAVRVVEPGDDPEAAEQEVADLLAERCPRHPTVTVEPLVLPGDPGTTLVQQAGSARLAVAGTRGDEPERGMLGAVSQALLYHAPAPVALIRAVAEES